MLGALPWVIKYFQAIFHSLMPSPWRLSQKDTGYLNPSPSGKGRNEGHGVTTGHAAGPRPNPPPAWEGVKPKPRPFRHSLL